jgi:hypothetical protein
MELPPLTGADVGAHAVSAGGSTACAGRALGPTALTAAAYALRDRVREKLEALGAVGTTSIQVWPGWKGASRPSGR